MKISNTLMLSCAFALALSSGSFAANEKKNPQKEEIAKKAFFDAYLFKVPETNKVKLIVDKKSNAKLRIVLSGKDGKIYYSETNFDNSSKYRRLFDMNALSDGVYYFTVYSKKQTEVKELKIQSASEKLVSLL